MFLFFCTEELSEITDHNRSIFENVFECFMEMSAMNICISKGVPDARFHSGKVSAMEEGNYPRAPTVGLHYFTKIINSNRQPVTALESVDVVNKDVKKVLLRQHYEGLLPCP